MRKFRGSGGILPTVLLLFLMTSIGPLWLSCMPESAGLGIGRVAFALLGLLSGWLLGSGLLEWFTVYEVDAEGITRRAWNGARRIDWGYLTGYEASEDKTDSLALMDNQNTRLTIEFSLLGAQSRRELHELIAPYLVPLREARMREISISKTVYHPQRGLMIVIGIGTILMSGFFFSGATEEVARKSPDSIAIGIFGSAALFVFLVGLWALILGLTRTLTVSRDGLTQSSLFGTRTILFGRVTAVMIHEAPQESDQQKITIVQDVDKKKIYLSSKMKDYPLVLEFIRTSVPVKALLEGGVQLTETLRKADRRARIRMPVCLIAMESIFLGFGVTYLAGSIPILAQQRQIDQQGQSTIGHVTRAIEAKSKVGYSIEYAFEDRQGRRVVGSSPASYHEFQHARAGTSVQIEYVPGSPKLNRRLHSTSTRGAVGGLVLAAVYLFAALVLIPCVLYEVWKGRKARADTILVS